MNITWAGFACFKIEGDSAVIVFDPFDAASGLKLPKTKAHVVLSTSDSSLHNNIEGVSGMETDPRVLNSPGEYEVKEVLVYGVAAPDGSTLYRVQMDGMTMVHLGSVSKALDTAQLEYLDKVDILFVPVGGGEVLDAERAASLVQQIEPRIVVPMMYKIPGAKVSLGGLEKFLSELGVKPDESTNKLKIAKKDLPSEDMKVIVFNPA